MEATRLEERFDVVLPPSALAPRHGRAFIADVVCRWELPDLLDVASLLVSEVVTNAVVHARTDSTLSIERLPGRVRIAVTDLGGGTAGKVEARPGGGGGRGLTLVDQLAVAWGVDRPGGRHRVWFDLAIDGHDGGTFSTV